MIRQARCVLLGLGASLSFAAQSAAAETPESTEPAAEVSVRAGAWSQSRDLGDPGARSAAELDLRATSRLPADLKAKAEVRLQAQSTGRKEADLPEAWLRAELGDAKITVGRQIVAWGRADRLNPTDVVGSRDYTRLLADDDEQRRGSMMAQVSYGAGPWTLSGLWLPEFRANRFPTETPPPGVVALAAERVRDTGQFALRIDHLGAGLDGSLIYFDGRDRTRDIVATAPGPGAPPGVFGAVQDRFARVRVLGGDLAGVAAGFGFRAEAAWTDVLGPASPFRKKDSLWVVAGVDRPFGDGWNINLQYSFRRVFGDRNRDARLDPFERTVARMSAAANNQLDPTQQGVTLRLARSWLNDTLSFECSGAAFFPRGDTAVRPRVNYALNDQWRVTVGADIFQGPKLSYFGRVRDLSAAYVQIARGF